MLNNTIIIKTSQTFRYYDYDSEGEPVAVGLLKFNTPYIVNDKKYAYCVAVIVYGRNYCSEPVRSPILFETREEANKLFGYECNCHMVNEDCDQEANIK